MNSYKIGGNVSLRDKTHFGIGQPFCILMKYSRYIIAPVAHTVTQGYFITINNVVYPVYPGSSRITGSAQSGSRLKSKNLKSF